MKDIIILLGFLFVPTTGVLTILWASERARARRAEETLYDVMTTGQRRSPQASNADVMAAIDSLAADVERISQAQQFTARILAERSERSASSALRPITPH